MGTIAGKVRMTHRGTWSSERSYEILDVVSNAGSTAAYIARQDVPAGIALTNTEYWDLLVEFNENVVYEIMDKQARDVIDKLTSPFTSTGSIIQCHPVEGYPLDVTVNLEPIQSGSGDPYPGGGGKNLFNPDLLTDNSSTHNGDDKKLVITQTAHMGTVTFVLEGEPYTDYTVSFAVTTKEADYNFCWLFLTEEETKTYQSTSTTGKIMFTRTSGASGKMQLSLRPTMEFGVTGSATVSEIMIERGSTASAYAPYSNIRPISGHTGGTVTRCGKNLLPPIVLNSATGFSSDGSGNYTCVSSATTTIATFAFRGGETYAISATQVSGSGIKPCIIVRNTDGSSEGQVSNYSNVYAPTVVSFDVDTTWNVRLQAASSKGTVAVGDIFAIQIELGSTATDYEPYHADTYPVEFGQTVYGGTHQVNTGEVDETWALVTLDGTETWNGYGDGGFSLGVLSDAVVPGYNEIPAMICSHYPAATRSVIAENKGVGVGIGSATHLIVTPGTGYTADTFKAFIAAQYAAGTPVQIAYKFATPNAITTTAHDILALEGMNTVYADAGDVTVNGRIDPDYMNTTVLNRLAALEAAIVSNV